MVINNLTLVEQEQNDILSFIDNIMDMSEYDNKYVYSLRNIINYNILYNAIELYSKEFNLDDIKLFELIWTPIGFKVKISHNEPADLIDITNTNHLYEIYKRYGGAMHYDNKLFDELLNIELFKLVISTYSGIGIVKEIKSIEKNIGKNVTDYSVW